MKTAAEKKAKKAENPVATMPMIWKMLRQSSSLKKRKIRKKEKNPGKNPQMKKTT